jgi:hypothetical protein
MRLGSEDMNRLLKEGLFKILCYSVYILLFGLLAVKLWIKIR